MDALKKTLQLLETEEPPAKVTQVFEERQTPPSSPIIEPRRDTNPNEHNLLPPIQTDEFRIQNFITYLDDKFSDCEPYKAYLHSHFDDWKDDNDFRMFDNGYRSCRIMRSTIKKFHAQAEELTNLVNQLENLENSQTNGITALLPALKAKGLKRHINTIIKKTVPPPTITNTETKRKLSKSIYPYSYPCMFISPHLCYSCKSPGHLQINCKQYQCEGCFKVAPRHTRDRCPVTWKEAEIQERIQKETAIAPPFSFAPIDPTP
jgi:hypothetical protein